MLYKLSSFILLSLLFTSFTMPSESSGSLILEMDNIKTDHGIIWVGIYDSEENYMVKSNAIVEGFDVTETGKLEVSFPDLEFGTYAIAIFHDLNSNGELDKNVLGIPSEPYAFSTKPKSKWRVPRFNDVKFDFNQNGQRLNTKLDKWKDQ